MDFLSLFIIVICSAILMLLAAVAFQKVYANHRTSFGEDYEILWSESLKEIIRTSPPQAPSSLSRKVSKLKDEWMAIKFLKLEDKILLLRAGYPPKEAHKALRKFGREAITTQAYLRVVIQEIQAWG